MPGRPSRQDDGPAWWRKAVVYQVYPRSFADSDGDGVGDLPGLLSKLDHLERLGVDVLWLSPFYPSPMADNGYDISDYTGVDPLFGTLHDVDLLIERLHERGIRLIVDVVLNHSSDAHPWFVASRSSADDPRRDWYIWRERPEGDWTSFFGGPVWQRDEPTGEYYLHLFDVRQPDLNWENPDVRRALHDVLRFWLERGVDGFRMDVINLISKDFGTGTYINGPRLHEFLAELNREVIVPAGRPLLTVGEMPGVTTEVARDVTDPARGELDMVFQFEHMSVDHGPGGRYDPVPLDLVRLKEVLGRWQTELAGTGWNSLYWCNHDQPRPVSRFGDDGPVFRELSAKTLATTLHMQRGTPFVFQGEELGLPNQPFGSIDEIDDVETRGHYAELIDAGADPAATWEKIMPMSRDHARTPMLWDDEPNAGFTTGTPWLPVHPDAHELNAQLQTHDPHSIFAHYRALIELRHEHPVIAEGDFTMLLADHPRVFAYTRSLEPARLLVVANWGDGEERFELGDADAWSRAELLIGCYADGDGGRKPGDLRPWESRVYLL